MSDYVRALAVFDDGTGPALYVGGVFTTAGGVSANYIARGDGTQWSPVGSGLGHFVNAVTVFADASGPALYVRGLFRTAGGMASNHIARWGYQTVPGDFDCDGDVDMGDFAVFNQLFTGALDFCGGECGSGRGAGGEGGAAMDGDAGITIPDDPVIQRLYRMLYEHCRENGIPLT